jgi:hypothetical protein
MSLDEDMLCLPSNSGIEGFFAGFINMVKLFSD